MKGYITQIDGAYRNTDSRVSLDSVVYVWRDGRAPEGIKQSLPEFYERPVAYRQQKAPATRVPEPVQQ
jgi:hypothetical protein